MSGFAELIKSETLCERGTCIKFVARSWLETAMIVSAKSRL
jgi:hypothetical protein